MKRLTAELFSVTIEKATSVAEATFPDINCCKEVHVGTVIVVNNGFSSGLYIVKQKRPYYGQVKLIMDKMEQPKEKYAVLPKVNA